MNGKPFQFFGQHKPILVQTVRGPRPLDDFTPYGNEVDRGQVYRGGQWINVSIPKDKEA